jgi:hypothetical protein
MRGEHLIDDRGPRRDLPGAGRACALDVASRHRSWVRSYVKQQAQHKPRRWLAWERIVRPRGRASCFLVAHPGVSQLEGGRGFVEGRRSTHIAHAAGHRARLTALAWLFVLFLVHNLEHKTAAGVLIIFYFEAALLRAFLCSCCFLRAFLCSCCYLAAPLLRNQTARPAWPNAHRRGAQLTAAPSTYAQHTARAQRRPLRCRHASP